MSIVPCARAVLTLTLLAIQRLSLAQGHNSAVVEDLDKCYSFTFPTPTKVLESNWRPLSHKFNPLTFRWGLHLQDTIFTHRRRMHSKRNKQVVKSFQVQVRQYGC